jgi:hypothetical protein
MQGAASAFHFFQNIGNTMPKRSTTRTREGISSGLGIPTLSVAPDSI